MKSPRITTLALAVLAGWSLPASAASIDYQLTVPFVDIGANDLTPTGLLSGTLSYDDDAMSGIGTFSLVSFGQSISGVFSGFNFLLPLSNDAAGCCSTA